MTDLGQRKAWSCDLALDAGIALSIYTPPGSNQSGASLYSASHDTGDGLTYGTQASSFNTQFSPFLLVVDNDDPQNGNAFYFQAQYNKVVVVPENDIDGTTMKLKRETDLGPWLNQKAGKGEKPWVCYFNDTLIEGFIYPSKPTASPNSTSGASMSTPPPSATPSPTASIPPWITQPPSDYITTILTMPSTTCTYTGVASELPGWLRDTYPDFKTSYLEGPGPGDRKRDTGDSTYAQVEDLPTYPYLIKLEERRVPGSPPPYCVKYQVLNNGQVNWIPDPKGNKIRMRLNEVDPGYNAYPNADFASRRKVRVKRDLVPGTCHCQWMVGQ